MIRVINPIVTTLFNQMTIDRIVRLIELLLVIMLAVALGRLVIDLIPAAPPPGNAVTDNPESQSDSTLQQSAASFNEQNRITPELQQLFGSLTSPTSSQEILQEPLQQTRLNLTLKGIIANEGASNSLALIAVNGGKEQHYKVGETIEGAEIIRIESRRVILRRNGVNEALDLEVRKLSGTNPVTTMPGRVSFGNGIRTLSDNERVIPRTTLLQQMNNLPALMQQAQALPYSENGQQLGFRISNLVQGSVFEQLGIRNDDLIQSINGFPVRTVEEAMSAYRTLASASDFRLALRRSGQDVNLNISVQ